VRAADADGDTVNTSFTVNVTDDKPTITGTVTAETVSEGGLTGGNSPGAATAAGTTNAPEALNINWGADSATHPTDAHGRTLSFLAGDNTTAIAGGTGAVNSLALAITGEQGTALTSGGVALVYTVAANSNGGETLSADGTKVQWDEPRNLQALQFWYDLVNKYKVTPAYTPWNDGPQEFVAGKTAIVWHSTDRKRMQRVLAAWDEHLVDPYLPRRLTHLLEDARFAVTKRTAIPLLNADYDPNTYSAGLIGFISAFVPGRQGLSESDVTAWADDRGRTLARSGRAGAASGQRVRSSPRA